MLDGVYLFISRELSASSEWATSRMQIGGKARSWCRFRWGTLKSIHNIGERKDCSMTITSPITHKKHHAFGVRASLLTALLVAAAVAPAMAEMIEPDYPVVNDPAGDLLTYAPADEAAGPYYSLLNYEPMAGSNIIVNIALVNPPLGSIYNQGDDVSINVYLQSNKQGGTTWTQGDIVFQWDDALSFTSFTNQGISPAPTTFTISPSAGNVGIGWRAASSSTQTAIKNFPGALVTTLNLKADQNVTGATITAILHDLASPAKVTHFNNDGNTIVGSGVSVSIVPEPSTIVFLAGMMPLMLRRCHRPV